MVSREFKNGMRDGLPIALGYFAVGFSLGITARNAGITAFQGFLMSLLNNASAGQYAGIALIGVQAAYWEMAVMILIANARYLLMSCAMSQKFPPEMPLIHRLLIGFDLTDELFGIAIAYRGHLKPSYMYGAMLMALPGWSLGTAAGITAGNVLPAILVNALSVAIYGMFLAVIIPPAREDKVVAGVIAVAFTASFCAAHLPALAWLSEGMKTILLTVIIAAAAALLFPRKPAAEGPVDIEAEPVPARNPERTEEGEAEA